MLEEGRSASDVAITSNVSLFCSARLRITVPVVHIGEVPYRCVGLGLKNGDGSMDAMAPAGMSRIL